MKNFIILLAALMLPIGCKSNNQKRQETGIPIGAGNQYRDIGNQNAKPMNNVLNNGQPGFNDSSNDGSTDALSNPGGDDTSAGAADQSTDTQNDTLGGSNGDQSSQSGASGSGSSGSSQNDQISGDDSVIFELPFALNHEFFTKMEEMIMGNSPHGKVKIWYSKNLQSLIDQPNFVAPKGSVAIKKFENDETSGYAIMIKRSSTYDPSHNNWEYQMRDMYGNLFTKQDSKGKIPMCISCHSGWSDSDYLAGTSIENISDSNSGGGGGSKGAGDGPSQSK